MISNFVQIHPNSKIADNVTVEAFTTIHENVEVGEGTWIGSNVTIYPGARVGKNCRIFPGAVISAIPQDLKFKGEDSLVEIGDNTTIRECVTINRGTIDKKTTKIGSNCLLMAYVHVAHDCIIGNNVIIANTVQIAGHVNVDDWAFIGGSSAIHQFVKIGMHSMVSGGSLVRKDVPPFTKAAREPLSYAGVNSLGLRRRGFSSEAINQIQEVYRLLFLNSMNNSRALEEIEVNLPATKERDEIVNFIRSSERGVMKGYIQ
ncbi:acyl-ACP--UDP-N-acetylglucosamine O-acyltransferase [Pleomorphovibrio marinus]|uniref:acyl-ACP--UDP-N-acetylglucosamine O-acyltransferase n=1 Tax=Pleomorphovibrio marinus TaxID=2164132 RepID=UPI000E0AC489|nr:acyl-ACP--UDP-N-acetylglucosamine O-acyltransferase [Pleomorphovibrio marinus]